ncbi:MarR family transcriptional regulator [Cupriavidus sp. WKF15]|uniref:MarR family winged helix-turn-helix transcriptional regulator n=1 Tax=Cupriavidus sp. WKF15 TaxID=3032282 RepID=UPI0023E31F87|nr:MarR family transcriptional regulator [Cupriavidus sp. WKF15]WER44583.1 MarR family transcriptional regulator [Cupriavidus sp. WKF15]
MHSKPLEPNEPVVLALMDAVTAWQGALEQTLSASGLNYGKWLLLRAIMQNAFVRHEPLAGVMPIDAARAEHMLGELQRDGWIEYSDSGAPRISAAAEGRVERVWQAVKALHSVSVSPFSSHERVALGALLQRMKLTLSDHSARRSRNPANEPVTLHTAAGRVGAGGTGAAQPMSA